MQKKTDTHKMDRIANQSVSNCIQYIKNNQRHRGQTAMFNPDDPRQSLTFNENMWHALLE